MSCETEIKPIVSKPCLRGLNHAVCKRNLFTALVLSGLVGLAMQKLYKEPRRKRIAEFYRKYDAMASFERMKEAGVLSSCPPGS